jgi:hypothetical protein
MSGKGLDRWRPGFSSDGGDPPAGEAGEDVIEQTSRRLPFRWRRPPRIAFVLGASGLIVGLAAGYAAGALRARSDSVPPPLSASATVQSVSSSQVGILEFPSSGHCSARTGADLLPGPQATNVPAPAAIQRHVMLVLPIGNVKKIPQAWKACFRLLP